MPIDLIISNSADVDLVCDSGGFITFTDEFCYLGTIISSDLRDSPDIDRRISQASKAFGSIRSSVFCNEKQLSPIIRRRLFMAIVMHLLLWGCETWALLSEDRNRLNLCFNSGYELCHAPDRIREPPPPETLWRLVLRLWSSLRRT